MVRVVSLTLFLLSWLLLFSNAASRERNEDIPHIKCQLCEEVVHQINKQLQKKGDQICPKKEIKGFTDTDSLCENPPSIDYLPDDLCHNLYREACSVEPPSPKYGIPDQPSDPKSLNDAEMKNMDSKRNSKMGPWLKQKCEEAGRGVLSLFDFTI